MWIIPDYPNNWESHVWIFTMSIFKEIVKDIDTWFISFQYYLIFRGKSFLDWDCNIRHLHFRQKMSSIFYKLFEMHMSQDFYFFLACGQGNGLWITVQFSSVKSRQTLWLHGLPQASLLCPTPTPNTNIQNWFPLGLIGLISLQSKGLSRVFSNTTVQKHQLFTAQLSLWSNCNIHTWLLEKPSLWLDGPLLAK